MSVIVLDIPLFREVTPEFADNPPYTDAMIQMAWDQATCFVDDCNFGRMQGRCRQTALNLMTAHILKSQTEYQDSGYNRGATFLTQAKVGETTNTRQDQPVNNSLDWYLGTTVYGQQLWAMLKVYSTGPFLINGLPESRAFRKVGGIL